MSKPAAVFVESNTTGSGEEFILTAMGMGLRGVLLTADPTRYTFLSAQEGVQVRICDTSSLVEIERTCVELSKHYEVKLIISTSDYYAYAAARLARQWNLRGPSPEAIELCRDKARQVAALSQAGVGTPPRWKSISIISEARQAITEVGLPAVIKPVSGTGSVGVCLARTEQDALAAISALLKARTNERGQRIDARCLVMTFVEGLEFSVELLDGEVVGITKKHLSSLPYFVETGHDHPAPVDAELRLQLESTALRALEAVGHLRGPAHVELRANPEGIFVIEVNPRAAGGHLPRLIRLATGFDLIRAVLESALNGRADLTKSARSYGCIRFLVPARDGRIEKLDGFDDVAARFELADVALYRTLPIQFKRENDFRDRIGHVIATDENAEQAQRRANAAAAFVMAQKSEALQDA